MPNSTIKSFGVLVNTLWIDQTSYTIIHSLNKLIKEQSLWSPVIFHLNCSPTIQTPLFGRMAMEHLVYFGWPAISTCLETSHILLNAVGPTKKFFYVSRLDWLYYNNAEEKYREIYSNPALNLIVRCQEHADLMQRCWLVPSTRLFIIEDLNYEKLTRIFHDE